MCVGDISALLLRPLGPCAAVSGAGPIGKLAAIQQSNRVIAKALSEQRGQPLSAQGGGHDATKRIIGVCGSIDHETPAFRKPEIDVA